MKNILYIFAVVIGVMFAACDKKNIDLNNEDNQEKVNEFFLQMEDRFLELGVSKIIDNYVLSDNELTILKESSYLPENLKSTKTAIFKSIYTDGSCVYAFETTDNEVFVTKVLENVIIRQLSVNPSESINGIEFAVTENNNCRKLSFLPDTKKLVSVTKDDEERISILKANCDELGARRPNESFNDCFERNWNNFCCDFIGCMVQITRAPLVAAAITLVCIC